MSATNHTSNYNLPIYESGNTANWLVDFNGAMSTIDTALNENKLAGDTLKTDMEELQTDFQQVSTKADAAEQAATLASTNAADALTIANNATTIAGDAKVDAHAVLDTYTRNFKPTKNLKLLGKQLIGSTDYSGRCLFYTNEMIDYTEVAICFKPSVYSKITELSYSESSLANHFYIFNDNLNMFNELSKFEYWNTLLTNTSTPVYYQLVHCLPSSPDFGAYSTSSQHKIVTFGLYITNNNNIHVTPCFGTSDVLSGTNTAYMTGVHTLLHTQSGIQPKLSMNNNIFTLSEMNEELMKLYPHLY